MFCEKVSKNIFIIRHLVFNECFFACVIRHTTANVLRSSCFYSKLIKYDMSVLFC